MDVVCIQLIKFNFNTTGVLQTISHTFFLLIKVHGSNLLRLYANNPTAYGRQLLDTLFTREELKVSLLFTSSKSDKPGLDRDRVDLLFGKWNVLYMLAVLGQHH